MAFLILLLGTVAFLFPQQVLTIDNGNEKGDVLVVLGGGDGRALTAAGLFRDGVAPVVLVTGYGDNASNIQILKTHGVPATVIISEPVALTTFENANLSIPILRKLGARRVILVTSWFHSRRALACFEHFAPDIRFFSRPTYAEYQPPLRTGFNPHVNYEYLKLLGYWIRYGVFPIGI